MPTPTIPAGNLFMNATLYTGDGAASKAVTNGVAGQAFQPDLVWIKDRSNARNNDLMDSIRGAGNGLFSNLTNAEVASGYLTSFNSNGFTTGNDVSTNGSGETYVGWQWKAGGTAVTNTSGTISSQVSANTTSGFSVVTYTGNGTNGATVGHGLGVAPRMLIVKNRTTGSTLWSVYHASVGAASVAHLNDTAAFSASGDWNSTTPTSTVFTIGTSNRVNTNTDNYVAYCWTPIAGYSAFGSYTGNGSTDGPFIYTGFRPKFFLLKSSSNSATRWELFDSSRFSYNGMDNPTLYANLSDAETSNSENYGDFLSNGFKLRATNGNFNGSGYTYIYMAFAENPLKFSNAR